MSTEWYCPKCGPIPSDEKYMSAVMWRCAKCNARIIEGIPRHVTAMQQQIATLETSLAERWENLNVQDGVVDGLREEIAALRESSDLLDKTARLLGNDLSEANNMLAIYASDASVLHSLIAALEKACAASAKCYPIVGIDVTSRTSYFDRKRMAEALREAGYLGGGE